MRGPHAIISKASSSRPETHDALALGPSDSQCRQRFAADMLPQAIEDDLVARALVDQSSACAEANSFIQDAKDGGIVCSRQCQASGWAHFARVTHRVGASSQPQLLVDKGEHP